MSKGNKLVAVRCEPILLDKIDADIRVMNRSRPKTEMNRSAWIRRAILEKLAHRERSKRHRGKKLKMCCQCHTKYSIEDIAWERQLLTGEKEYCCNVCDLERIA